MDNDKNNNISEIDLTKIDWNKLSVEEFNQLELELNQKERKARIAAQVGAKRITGNTTIVIKGAMYNIKTVDYNRLKAMKSPKAKEKLIKEILATNQKIESI